MGELGKWKPVAPVGLSMVDEDLKVFLDFLIDSFCLAIRLQMEGCGCVGHDIEHPVEFLHEFQDKLGSPVRDYSRQHSMSGIDMVTEYLGPSFS